MPYHFLDANNLSPGTVIYREKVMIRTVFGTLAVILLFAPALAEPHRYELDPEHTTVSFLVDHLGYANTLGIFRKVEGGFTYDMETRELSDVEVRVDSASVDTFHDARDNHVRGKDFLNVEAHPAMTFKAGNGVPTGDNTGTVEGELTLLGQTHPLKLNVTLNGAKAYPFGHGRFTLGLTIRGTVKRSQYGMMYAVENGFVGDEVQLIIETEAMRVK